MTARAAWVIGCLALVACKSLLAVDPEYARSCESGESACLPDDPDEYTLKEVAECEATGGALACDRTGWAGVSARARWVKRTRELARLRALCHGGELKACTDAIEIVGSDTALQGELRWRACELGGDRCWDATDHVLTLGRDRALDACTRHPEMCSNLAQRSRAERPLATAFAWRGCEAGDDHACRELDAAEFVAAGARALAICRAHGDVAVTLGTALAAARIAENASQCFQAACEQDKPDAGRWCTEAANALPRTDRHREAIRALYIKGCAKSLGGTSRMECATLGRYDVGRRAK